MTKRIGIALLCLGIVCKIAWAVPAQMEAAVCEELDLVSSMALLGIADDDEGLASDD
ncbi:hypothetical protein [Rugamonas apoptosis]|uniref:Uncharacterized protein n=1 Tax=Rugamonas apoptosis TaxID=2758570 RepID=A0A7W2FFE3_9BURK|nr:hypothetical protein [Rugamonas apoptosis]MBA5690579.1 hypothetical protein [Rugamonas apoptosis]